MFVYTITDGDGDTSTTTLTITVTNGAVAPAARRDGQRGGAGYGHGSAPTSARHGDGFAARADGGDATHRPAQRAGRDRRRCTYALVTAERGRRRAPTARSKSTPNGSYTYTLTAPSTRRRTPTRRQHDPARELHLHGDRRRRQHHHRTITVTIVDDVPTAVGQRLGDRGRAADGCGAGILSNDVAGADGRPATIAGVRAAGGDTDDGGDQRGRDGLRGRSARCICRPTAATPTSRRRTRSRRTPPTCSSTRSGTATATCRRRR